MPTIGPFTAARAGNTLSGYALGFAMRQLEPGDRERIQRSFVKAVEWGCFPQKEQEAREKGGARKTASRARNRITRTSSAISHMFRRKREQPAIITRGSGDRAAIKIVANDLTKTWFRKSTKQTAGSGIWTSALNSCLKRAAREQSAGGRSHSREWRYVIVGSEAEPTQANIDEWASEISEQVVRYWNRDRHLVNLVAQLNVDSGLGLQRALVASSQRISRSLLQIALAVTILALVGGGGIALLVLFIDKG